MFVTIKNKYKPLPKGLVRDKIPKLHSIEFNVVVDVESIKEYSLEEKEKVFVDKLKRETSQLFESFLNRDIDSCCVSVVDVREVILAIRKYVRKTDEKGLKTYSYGTYDLIHRVEFFISFIIRHFNNGLFESWAEDYRKSKKMEQGLFTSLLVVKGEKKNPKK
jgi:hypothetical protein